MAGTHPHTARPFSIRRRHQIGYLHAIDALESRLLMDADLLPVWHSWGTAQNKLIEGDSLNKTASIYILNANNPSTAVPAGKSIDIKVFARPADALDNSHDTLINKGTFKFNVSNLAVNSSKQADIPIILTNLTHGDYKLVAQVDTTNVVAENDETNNYTNNNFNFTILPPPADLFLMIDPANPFYTKPLVSDGTTKSTIKIQVRNFDTVATGANQMATFTVVAHRTSDDQEFALPAIAPIKIGTIAPGKTKPVTLTETLPLGMEGGAFVFKVSMTTDIPSDGTSNNDDMTFGFNASRGFVDMVTTITSVNITSPFVAGVTKTGVMKVDLTNGGNVPLPTTQHVNLVAYLHATNATDNSSDIVIGQTLNQKISKLAPVGPSGKPKVSASISLTVLNNVNPNDYVYLLKVTPVEPLTEESLANNSQSGSTLTIQPAQADLSFATISPTFPANSTGGDSMTASFTIRNGTDSNVTAPGNVTVTYYASASLTIDNNATAIGHTTLANFSLAPGKTSGLFKVSLTLPNPGSTTAYNILAKVTFDDGNVVTDPNPSNNVTSIDSTTTTHGSSIWGDNVVFPSVIRFGPNDTGVKFFEHGNIMDTSGNVIGTFTQTIPPFAANIWGIEFSNPYLPNNFLPTFNGSPVYVAGKTVTFSLTPIAGANGTCNIGGKSGYFKFNSR